MSPPPAPPSRFSLGLPAAFLAGFLVVGVHYWRVPYNEATSSAMLWGEILIGVVALSAGAVINDRFSRIALTATCAVPAAVLARVVVDTMRDPTSHNLWPFEVGLAFMVGLAGAVPGALIGSAIRRWT